MRGAALSRRSLRAPALAALAMLVGCGDGGAEPAAPADAEGTDSQQALGTEVDPRIAETHAADTEPAPEPEAVPLPEDLDLAFRDLSGYVDPLLGTDGPGNVIPGALVPHGAVRASPDTLSKAGSIDAYEYGDSHLEGFTHSHLEGPGGSQNGYSQLLLLPQVGERRVGSPDAAVPFDHGSEDATPGWYTVTIGEEAGGTGPISVELTATANAAIHRYTLPDAPEARLLIDLGHSNGQSRGGHVEVLPEEAAVEGWAEYQMHPLVALAMGDDETTGRIVVFFRVELDIDVVGHGVWRGKDEQPGEVLEEGKGIGAWLDLDAAGGATAEARVGLSWIDLAQARANLITQVAERSLEDVVEAAEGAWNQRLNRLHIEGDDEALTKLYTGLYRTFFQPADHMEGGRFHVGTSGSHEVRDGADAGLASFFTDDWCLWDTYRTSHPLQALLEPETRDDVVGSLLAMYEAGGWLPKCTWTATGYSRVMIGHHAVSVIADALARGFDGFDEAVAWEASWKAAMEDSENPGIEGLCGYLNLGTTPAYLDHGYVPSECDPTQAASMTLEYAYDDWCIARIAEATGHESEATELDARSRSYEQHWDDELKFMRGRRADGAWVEPFDPTDWQDTNDFVEASSWIFSFFVPHDVPGLLGLYGTAELLVERLDAFFAEGHFDPTNQPSFHIPWLYAWVPLEADAHPFAAMERTAARVRVVAEEHYGVGRGGLPGNDDAGSTSALYVLSVMGLFPLSPGDGRWTLAPPLSPRVTLPLDPDWHPADRAPAFVIEAVRESPEHQHILSVTLNGEPHLEPWIDHADIVRGGHLVFELGPGN